MKRTPSHRHAPGFSLVELMIGLVLATFLLIGMVQVFSATHAVYRASSGISRIQENSRFAMNLLAHDTRMAGHMGCTNDIAHFPTAGGEQTFFNHFSPTLPDTTGADYGLHFEIPIQGYEANGTVPGGGPYTLVSTAGAANTWTPTLSAAITGLSPAPIAGSDILALRFFEADNVLITGVNIDSANPTMSVPAEFADADNPDRIVTYATGDANPLPNYGLYGTANCSVASVFKVTSDASVGADPSKATFDIDDTTAPNAVDFTGLEATYQSNGTDIYPLASMVYYVGMGTGGIPSLWRARYTGVADTGGSLWATPEELVEGVEMMQITYGVDSDRDGIINNYLTASGVSGTDPIVDTTGFVIPTWRLVNAVRLSLLLRSPERASTADTTTGNVVVGGVTVRPPTNSGVLRATYDITIALRNRLPGR